MLDEKLQELVAVLGRAFEAISKNQVALAKGIEQVNDNVACLTLAVMAHGHISEATYELIQKQVAERRQELRLEPATDDMLAKIFKATKPSDN